MNGLRPNIDQVLQQNSGIKLDIGCGNNKQGPEWVGLDMVEYDGVDIVWDLNKHPYPLPDSCVVQAIASHIVEHIPAVSIRADGSTWFPFIEFMDEVWRIMRYDAPIAIAHPYGWSKGFFQDPTHIHAMNEVTWTYFDPLYQTSAGVFFSQYKPKPWKISHLSWNPSDNVEVVLMKRREDPSYYD